MRKFIIVLIVLVIGYGALVLHYLHDCRKTKVVQCKKCKHWQRNVGVIDSPNGHCFYLDSEMNEHDFCSYGERREDGG